MTTATEELKDSIQRAYQRQFSSYGQGVEAKVKTGGTGTTIVMYAKDQVDQGDGTDWLTE